MAAPLPAGVSPVTAGRLGLWLLGLRQQTAKSRRVAFPHRAYRSDGGRIGSLIAPWLCHEYPGMAAVVAAIAGVKRETAQGWFRGKGMSRQARERLAVYLEDRAAQMVAMAAELRAGTRKTAARRIDQSIALRQDAAGTIKILTNGARSGPAPFARAEPTEPQVNAEIFNAGQPSIRPAQTPKPSKKFGTQTSGKAKRKTRR